MAAVVGDFTGTGTNTLCFNDFNETIFFEYENKNITFNYFSGYATSSNSLFFS